MRVEVYFFGEEKNIPSCVPCKQGVLRKKCNLKHHYKISLLTTLVWQAFCWLCSFLGRQWASDFPHSAQLSPLPGRTVSFCPTSPTPHLQ